MSKIKKIFKMMMAIVMQMILVVMFAFTEIEVSPCLYLIVWCFCARMFMLALTYERTA